MYLGALLLFGGLAVAEFQSTTTFDFTGNSLPTGLSASRYTVNEKAKNTVPHRFVPKNVKVHDGVLQLLVPGGQTKAPISSAEVSTNFKMLYASVRTWAILTDVAGVCNGNFFYKSDSQEVDIEWLSDATSKANPKGKRVMHYTNQALNGNPDDATSVNGPAPKDATSKVHEYRLDWTANATSFYIDGVLQRTLEKNVPNKAGAWVWNNWVNESPYWTKGPPKTDAYFKIKKVVIEYNPA